jgi:uncharacterized protein YbjT (DUF2867 family)
MILVTGATGNVGQEVVRELAGAGQAVRALTRGGSSGAAPGFSDLPGVDVVTGDLDHPETLRAPLAGVRGVFLLPGYADMDAVVGEIRGAGVERVVLLSGSSARSGDESNAVTAYMLRSERAVEEAGGRWTILRPFGFMANALRWRDQLDEGDVVREPFAAVPIAVIDPVDIAVVAVAALLDEGHDGQTYLLSGPEPLTAGDRVRILGEVLGRDLRLDALDEEQARAKLTAEMPAEYVHAFFDFYVDGSLDESEVSPAVHDLLGRSPRSFRQWATDHRAAFG